MLMSVVQNFKQRLAKLRNAKRLARNEDGTVLIEFAAGLTFFMLIGFGGVEYMNYITIHTRISQIALTVADNASRSQNGTSLTLPQMRQVDVNDIFKGAELQSQQFKLNEKGKIILSSLEVNSSGSQVIRWQRCFGNGPYSSSFGKEGATPSGGMGPAGNKVTAQTGSAVMFVEVIYPYEPFLYGEWMSESSKKIQYTAAFQVRDARDLAAGLTNPSPQAPVQMCP